MLHKFLPMLTFKNVVSAVVIGVIVQQVNKSVNGFGDISTALDRMQQKFFRAVNPNNDTEFVEFNINFLKRRFFDDEFKILPEAQLIYTKAYPLEMEQALDAGGYLRIEYRPHIEYD